MYKYTRTINTATENKNVTHFDIPNIYLNLSIPVQFLKHDDNSISEACFNFRAQYLEHFKLIIEKKILVWDTLIGKEAQLQREGSIKVPYKIYAHKWLITH